MAEKVILVSNGPGELQTWVRPVLKELRQQAPGIETVISLIPCQFASGAETRIAAGFGADYVTSPAEAMRVLSGTGKSGPLSGSAGAVIGLGGNTRLAVGLARKLDAAVYRYSFVPYWHRALKKLYVHDESARRKARLLGAPSGRLENIGNLVADALAGTEAAPRSGEPALVLLAGSRERYTRAVLPLLLAALDLVAEQYPGLQVTWPVSRLLGAAAVDEAIAASGPEVIADYPSRREGDEIVTPAGLRVRMVQDSERYAWMKAADLALTIPGTNTLELGIAGTPAVVVLPLNKPEIIALEGPGHWLSLLPVIGTPLKRKAVTTFVQRLNYPVSLPNQFSGENLMTEVKGLLTREQVAENVLASLADRFELARRSQRLLETMPRPGAAERLVSQVLADMAERKDGA